MWQASRLAGLLTVVMALVVVTSAQGTRPLKQRTLLVSDLPGFKVDTPPTLLRSANAWLNCKQSHRYKDAAALQARGFIAGAREHLYLTRAGLYAADASSSVIQFKSPQGALANLNETLPGGNAEFKPFTVPGIPGARGAATTGVNSDGLIVAFADGRFSYFLGVAYLPHDARHPTRASIIAAAQALYRRVHRA
jgi:hypothetical protein